MLFLLFLMLAFSPGSVCCMEENKTPSKAEIAKAYEPIPRPKLTDIHDIAPFCTQMAVRLHRQPIKKCTFYERGEKERHLRIAHRQTACLVDLMSRASHEINNHAWNIVEEEPQELLKRNPYVRGQYCSYMIFANGDAGDSRCSIAQLGRVYEKVVTILRSGWSFAPSAQRDPEAWTFVRHSYFENSLDQMLLSNVSSLLDVSKCYYATWNKGNSRICVVSIEKEHFQAVQSKLQFDLPAKSELEAL